MVTNEAIGKGAKLVPKDTILLLVRGSMLFNRIPVGITTREVTFNQDVKAVSTNEILNTYFLFYWLKHYENRLLNLVTGTGIGAGKLDTPQLQSLKISIPEHKEQQKIADFLSSVDNKISLLKEKKSLMQRYKKGVMQKLFSQELRFKDENREDFGDWEETQMDKISKLMGGYAFPSAEMSRQKQNYQLIKMSNLYAGNLDIDRNPSYINELESNHEQYLIEHEDILITLTGTFMKRDFGYTVSMSKPRNLLLNQRVGLIRGDKNQIVSKFLFYITKTRIFGNKFHTLAIGGTGNQANVSLVDCKKLKINIPSIQEQQKIANFLSEIDKKIDSVTQQIEQTKTFKKGLLQKMFV